MSDLIQLNKYELISKIQSINRENNKLKTLLLRHQLLSNFYQKLYQNCVQLNELKNNKNDNQIKNKLKLNEKQILSQIETISKCEKNIEISLPVLQTQDIQRNQLFFEKSTQYELTDNLCEKTNKKKHSKCAQKESLLVIDCNQIKETLNESPINVCTESSLNTTITSNNELKSNKSDYILNFNESQLNCLSNDVNSETAIDCFATNLDNSIDIIETNKKLKNFVCNYCHKRYKLRKSLDNHVIKIHRYITSESKLENHINKCETSGAELGETKIKPKTNNMIVCQWPDCRLKFKNRTNFLRHYSIHNESRKLCSDCGLRFDDSNQLREHMIWHSNQFNGLTVNQIEGQKSTDSEELVNGNESKHKCDFTSCEFSCDNRIDLFKHYSKHNITDRRFTCLFPNCNYKTANYNNLEVHQKKAHEKIYISL